jgi:hypothetical protein
MVYLGIQSLERGDGGGGAVPDAAHSTPLWGTRTGGGRGGGMHLGGNGSDSLVWGIRNIRFQNNSQEPGAPSTFWRRAGSTGGDWDITNRQYHPAPVFSIPSNGALLNPPILLR